MSLCTRCGRLYCDHTPEERKQTPQEMIRRLSAEETVIRRAYPAEAPERIRVAQKHAHDRERKDY